MNIDLQPSSKLTFIKNHLLSPQRLTSSLQITNNSNNTVAYSIRTNSGQKYSVKPDRGQIKSGDSTTVTITIINKQGENQENDLFFVDFLETAGFNPSELDQKIFWDQVQNKNVKPKTFLLSVDFYKREDFKNKFKSLTEDASNLNYKISKSNKDGEKWIRDLKDYQDSLSKRRLIMSQRLNSGIKNTKRRTLLKVLKGLFVKKQMSANDIKKDLNSKLPTKKRVHSQNSSFFSKILPCCFPAQNLDDEGDIASSKNLSEHEKLLNLRKSLSGSRALSVYNSPLSNLKFSREELPVKQEVKPPRASSMNNNFPRDYSVHPWGTIFIYENKENSDLNIMMKIHHDNLKQKVPMHTLSSCCTTTSITLNEDGVTAVTDNTDEEFHDSLMRYLTKSHKSLVYFINTSPNQHMLRSLQRYSDYIINVKFYTYSDNFIGSNVDNIFIASGSYLMKNRADMMLVSLIEFDFDQEKRSEWLDDVIEIIIQTILLSSNCLYIFPRNYELKNITEIFLKAFKRMKRCELSSFCLEVENLIYSKERGTTLVTFKNSESSWKEQANFLYTHFTGEDEELIRGSKDDSSVSEPLGETKENFYKLCRYTGFPMMLALNNNEYIIKSKRQTLQFLFNLMLELKIINEEELRNVFPKELDVFERQELNKYRAQIARRNPKLAEALRLSVSPILKKNDGNPLEATTMGSLRTTRIASDNRVQFDMENSTSMFYHQEEGEQNIEVIADTEEVTEEDQGLRKVGMNLGRNPSWHKNKERDIESSNSSCHREMKNSVDIYSCHQLYTGTSSSEGIFISHYSYPEDMFQSTFRTDPQAPSDQMIPSIVKPCEFEQMGATIGEELKPGGRKGLYKNLKNFQRRSLAEKDHERIKSMKVQKRDNFPDCVHSKNVKSHH